MSAEGEQQRRPGAPDDTDGKRRLRAVSYPDPYLVTKLPLEATVNSGVIRLGERMLLGFIHRPYPDGTRVRVVYDEWLFAERLDEGEAGDEGGGEAGAAAGKGTRKRGKARSQKSSGKARASTGKGSGKGESEGGGKPRSEDEGDSAEGAGRTGTTEEEVDAAKRIAAAANDPAEPDTADAEAGSNDGAPDSPTGNRFPEDFYDKERRASGDPDGGRDAWTETFERNERDD